MKLLRSPHILITLLLLSGCGSMGGLADAAVEPGTDSRCFVGLGMEFCYYRERKVNVQRSDTEND